VNNCVSIKTVEFLTGEDRRRIWERTSRGEYIAKKQNGMRGPGGENYLVAVSSLPLEAQIIYLQRGGVITGPVSDDCDLAGYRARFGDEGLRELLQKQRAVLQGMAIRKLNPEDVVAQLSELAADHGTTLRSLYRWMDAYEEKGLPGIMRAMARKDKGIAISICPAAYQFAYGLYADKVKRTQATIYNKLRDRAEAMGPKACAKCIFNEGTPARRQLMLTDEINHYPPCNDPDKKGMRVPECRQTLSRILNAIPDEEITLARRGVKAWKNDHMVMAEREKPQQVNRVWFGDHHQFDAFVLDERGKAVRPWLTAWYDAATGCPVGWVLCTNPNTETITEAFIRGVAHTQHSPFYGLPVALYIDNGKDYRSKTFEAGLIKEHDLGYLNANIASNSVIQLFNIAIHHAVPYHAWSKTIERFFGTLEDIWIREVPGWCGNSPDERPEDFSADLRKLIERGQLWTMDQFYNYLRDTVMPEYINRPHEGHGNRKPIDLYNILPRARDDQPSWAMLAVARLNMKEAKITQQGIRFRNRKYWDDAMIGLAGTDAVIRYSDSDLSSVTVLVNNRFLCEAGIKERLQLIDEDPEKLAAHMSKQKRQLADVKERIRRASRAVFADDVDNSRSAGNITGIEYEKAAKARKAKQAEIKAPKRDDSGDAVRSMFAQMGDDLLRKAR
jgi:putative transposase